MLLRVVNLSVDQLQTTKGSAFASIYVSNAVQLCFELNDSVEFRIQNFPDRRCQTPGWGSQPIIWSNVS